MAWVRMSGGSAKVEVGTMIAKTAAGSTTQTYNVIKKGRYTLFVTANIASTNSSTLTFKINNETVKTLTHPSGSSAYIKDWGNFALDLKVGDVVTVTNNNANTMYVITYAMV